MTNTDVASREGELSPIPQHDLDSLGTPEKVAAAEKLWARLLPMAPDFTLAISNPPYQREVGRTRTSGTRTSVDIFPTFQRLACDIAERTSLVYPATWQKNVQEGLGKFLLDNGLVSSSTYRGETIFDGIIIPVSVVATKRGYTGNIMNNGRVEERHTKLWIDYNHSAILHERTKHLPKIAPGAKVSPRIANAETSDLTFTKEARSSDDVKVLLKKRPGKVADSQWFHANREAFLSTIPGYNVDEYKVSLRSRILGRQSLYVEVVFSRGGGHGLRSQVFPPGESHGDTWFQLASFPTEEEASNFSAYINTMAVAYLGYLSYTRRSFGEYIPDLGDYTNSNPLFMEDEALGTEHEYYRLSLEERLYGYFRLSPDEMEVLRSPLR